VSEYSVAVLWDRNDDVFVDGRYSRAHRWQFDGGSVVKASSSPHSVPLPYSDSAGVDPEEAFVAALASCHMLWFLSIAAKQGYRVESYSDKAAGMLARGPNGKLCMTAVTLRPHVTFSGTKLPMADGVRAMHEQAHAECYIANSVTTHITTEPTHDVVVTDPR
jgi:organic hydroperoxide reductase OsmC/OhrA